MLFQYYWSEYDRIDSLVLRAKQNDMMLEMVDVVIDMVTGTFTCHQVERGKMIDNIFHWRPFLSYQCKVEGSDAAQKQAHREEHEKRAHRGLELHPSIYLSSVIRWCHLILWTYAWSTWWWKLEVIWEIMLSSGEIQDTFPLLLSLHMRYEIWDMRYEPPTYLTTF